MLQIRESASSHLHIVVDGKVEPSDTADFVPAFERLVRSRPTPVSMLVELGPHFGGWSLAALWQELKFDVQHAEAFGPVAIVGDARWQKWATQLSNPFFSARMRFFEPAQIAHAQRWLDERAAGSSST
jgi:hypothetical protein